MKHFLLFLMTVFSLLSIEGYSQNIFPQGDMESGVADWTAKFRNGAVGTVGVTTDAVNGSQAMLIDVTTAAPDGDLTKGQAQSDVFTDGFTNLACYKISAVMKSNVTDNEMKMKILPVDDGGSPQHISSPKNPDETFYHLTTEYKKFQWLVNNIKPGYSAGYYLQLQVGSYVAQYFVDDLMIEKIVGIENGDFENEEDLFAISQNIATESGAAANISIDTDNVNGGGKALKVEVTTVNDTVGAVNIVTDTRFYPETGKKYEYTVYAKGTNANDSLSLDVNFYDSDNGFLELKSKMVELTTEYQKYSFVFETESTDVYSVRFRLGFGKQVSVIYVDDMNVGDATEVPNDVPVAVDDAFTTDQDVALSENVSTNDTESTDGGNVWTLLANATNGAVALENNGSFTYTPTAGFFGSDSFTYTLCDGDGDCDTATVSITVNEVTVDHMPVAVADTFETEKNQVLSASVAGNDTPGDGENAYAVATQPANGTVTMGTDGSFTYTPTTDYKGEDSFTYTLCDADNDCSTATVHITVLTPVGIADISEGQFRCYPNPAGASIQVTGAEVGARIQVISITGVMVKEVAATSGITTIDLGNVVQGTYLLRSNDKIVKFIKK